METGSYNIPPEKVIEVNQKYQELLAIEFEIGIKPIKDISDIGLSPKEIILLEPLFDLENISQEQKIEEVT